LRLDELRPGMVVGRPVHNLQNILLLKEGAVVTDKTITVLKTWGVPAIQVRADMKSMDGFGGRPDATTRLSIENRMKHKFSGHVDNPVMAEIMRVAQIQIQKRLTNRPN